jgi:hypothetical protein
VRSDFTKYAVPASLDRTVTPLDVVTLEVATVGVGAVASTVIVKAAELVALPAVSVSVTVMLQVPSDKDARSQVVPEIVHKILVAPVLAAVTTAVPANEPETLIVGVLTEVILSVEELPESDAVARAGVEGVPGAVVSTTKALFAPKEPVPVGDGKVNTAAVFPEFLIVPLFNASELVAT